LVRPTHPTHGRWKLTSESQRLGGRYLPAPLHRAHARGSCHHALWHPKQLPQHQQTLVNGRRHRAPRHLVVTVCPLSSTAWCTNIPFREEAHATLATNPFFAAWDPRALAAYVGHGLVAMPGSGVTLAMPSIQEALTFEATKTSAPVWDLLPTLEERIPLRWVVPGRPGEPECVLCSILFRSTFYIISGSLGGPGATQERVWRRPANSSNVRIAQAGHLVRGVLGHSIVRLSRHSRSCNRPRARWVCPDLSCWAFCY
jgi:hypothetical protein